MLAIARALLAKPKLLLLDEPSLGLSPLVAAKIIETLRRLNAEGVSILLVEQNAGWRFGLLTARTSLRRERSPSAGARATWQMTLRLQAAYLGQ